MRTGIAWAHALHQAKWSCAVVTCGLAWAPAHEVLDALRRIDRQAPIWLVTDRPSIAEAVAVTRAGAADYLTLDLAGLATLARHLKLVAADQAETVLPTVVAAPRSTDRMAPDTHRLFVHDLQEPLRTAQYWLRALDASVGTGDTAASTAHIHKIIKMLQRLQERVTGALAPGKPEPELETLADVDVTQVWSEVQADLAEAVERTGASVSAGPLPAIRMRRAELVIVLQNLLENALKYRSDAPPLVSLTARAVGQFGEFRVEDNGRGIAPGDRLKVMQFFERGAEAGTENGHGIGLGRCGDIVRDAGGSIWIDPATVRGTVVCFTAPIAASKSPDQ